MNETQDLTRQHETAEALAKVFDDLEDKSNRFGSALTQAMSGAIVGGKGLDDVLRGLAMRMSSIALQTGMKPLESLISGGIGSLFGSLGGLVNMGGAQQAKVIPFADGGVISRPTYFPMSGADIGLMGEAGSEAIMPLKRGPDGTLGVAAAGSTSTPQIIFNVTTNDAQSFRKSEAQISAMLTRSVMRGQRNL